jgi:hypothetical protein
VPRQREVPAHIRGRANGAFHCARARLEQLFGAVLSFVVAIALITAFAVAGVGAPRGRGDVLHAAPRLQPEQPQVRQSDLVEPTAAE